MGKLNKLLRLAQKFNTFYVNGECPACLPASFYVHKASRERGKESNIKIPSFLLPELSKKQCHPFIVDGMMVGLIRPDIYKHLLDYKDVFTFHPAPAAAALPKDDYRVGSVELNRQFTSYEERSNVVDRVLRELRDKRCLVALKGWRDEVKDWGLDR